MINGMRACEHPSKENFDAPRPQELQTYFTIGAPLAPHPEHPEQQIILSSTSTSLPSTTTLIVAPTFGAHSHGPKQESNHKGLSGAAAGGIGAGVAVTVLAVIGLLAFLCRRRRKRTIDGKKLSSQSLNSPPQSYHTPMAHVSPVQPAHVSWASPSAQMAYDPPPFYPTAAAATSTTTSTPMTQQESFAAMSTAEMGSHGKLGNGHPLEAQEQAGLPMRHELPTDNELRPAGIVSPLSPIQDASPMSPMREENSRPAPLNIRK